MPWHHLIWTDRALEKIGLNGVAREEVVEVMRGARRAGVSRSTGLPIYVGWTRAGRRLVVVFKWLDKRKVTVEVVTAYEPARR